MTRHQRDCVDICRSAGLNPVRIEHRGKHIAVVCVEGKLFCSSTPSDHRFKHNLKADARRMLRAATAA